MRVGQVGFALSNVKSDEFGTGGILSARWDFTVNPHGQGAIGRAGRRPLLKPAGSRRYDNG